MEVSPLEKLTMRLILRERQRNRPFCRSVQSGKRNPATWQGFKLVAGVGFEPTAFRL
jgi:hypothetical protein